MVKNHKMGLNATWSMAVGGMIGGGIFSVLGFIVNLAGNYAWISFIIAGLIALATGISYSNLTHKYHTGGGSFTYLKKLNYKSLAGAQAWLLIMGYILTISVYAFTFGHYLNYVLKTDGEILVRLFSVIIVLLFVIINFRGVGNVSWTEIVTVWGKLIILLLITGFGLQYFHLSSFTGGVTNKSQDILLGAASVFMAYEGFQLIAYDYNDIHDPKKTIHKALILAIISVIIVYVLVTIGTILLVNKETIIHNQEVVIALAGKNALGTFGLILASIAALFSTSSAINSTLFSSARLTKKISTEHEFPGTLRHENSEQVPDRAIILIGGLGALISAFGSLNQLVEGASFIFLVTFAIVNWIALIKIKKYKLIALFGLVGSTAASVSLIIKFITQDRIVLIFLFVLTVFVTYGRKLILKYTKD